MVDQILPGTGGSIGDKGFHFFRSWRKTQQVKIDPSDQGAPVCPGRGCQTFFGPLRIDEGIDGMRGSHPYRRHDIPNRLEGPMTACLVGDLK